jgi:uncharacterized metal-binding protein YceD (DUF177 family)
MNALNAFDIEIQNLKPGAHHFSFSVGDEFFQAFDYGMIDSGDLKVELDLQKSETLVDMLFNISGVVELTCDRSLDTFDHPMQLEEQMVLKYGEEAGEVDEHMEVIPWNTYTVNVARYLYEMITVAIPMKKLHPRYEQQENERDELIYVAGGDQKPDMDDNATWEQLKKFKDK